MPGVVDAAAVARTDAGGELRIITYVVPDAGTTTDAAALRAGLADRLPAGAVPDRVVLVERDAQVGQRQSRPERAARSGCSLEREISRSRVTLPGPIAAPDGTRASPNLWKAHGMSAHRPARAGHMNVRTANIAGPLSRRRLTGHVCGLRPAP